jgi:hypothetical protein
MTKPHEELLQEFRDYATAAPTVQSLMERIAKRLHEKMARYNWAGSIWSTGRTQTSWS